VGDRGFRDGLIVVGEVQNDGDPIRNEEFVEEPTAKLPKQQNISAILDRLHQLLGV
jgi:hypothetical protein